MAAYACPFCRQQLHFEARACDSCGHALGFRPETDGFLYLDEAGGWTDARGDAAGVQPCANARYGVCNWLLPAGEALGYCRACRHNRTIPDLAVPGVLDRWRKVEDAKRRLFNALVRLGLPLETRAERPDGLAFDILYDANAEAGYAPSLPTGHQGGLVTINLVEADDVQRERIRREMGEPYRTLVGHFRHEVGHHYWSRLIEHGPKLDEFRRVFGDERIDYAGAMSAHYGGAGRPDDWSDSFVSAYAAAHPWEDFAETFAHFLHIVDTLATIAGLGLSLDVASGDAAVDVDPYRADTASLAARWIPFAFALNATNRSMGQPDLYPFRLTPGVVLKLDFINRMIADAAGRGGADIEVEPLKAMIATLGHPETATGRT